MFYHKHVTSLSALIAVLLFLAGCSSTRVLHSWKEQTRNPDTIKNILIVGVTTNDLDRRLFEDSYAAALAEAGISARPSYTELVTERMASKDNIKSAARLMGMEYVLVTHMVKSDKRQVYRPRVTYTAPVGFYHSYSSYYPRVYTYVHEPGYYTTHEYVQLESNLYALDSEKLLWSAATETVDPKDIQKVAGELSKVLVKQMKADGVIASGQ